jgi:hypothetical protein
MNVCAVVPARFEVAEIAHEPSQSDPKRSNRGR